MPFMLASLTRKMNSVMMYLYLRKKMFYISLSETFLRTALNFSVMLSYFSALSNRDYDV